LPQNLNSAYIKIDSEKCKGCCLCISFCAKRIIGLAPHLNRSGYTPVVTLEEKADDCTGCTACAAMCPDAAISVYRRNQH